MDSGSSSLAADAVASLAKKAAPSRAPTASPLNNMVPAPAPAPAASPEKEVPAPAAWGRPPAPAEALAGVPVIGGAEYWPALSGGMVMPAAAASPKWKAPPAAVAPPPTKPTGVAASIGNSGASRTGPGDRAAPAPAPERCGAVRKQSPAHAPNHRSNCGAPGHQNGRSPPHPHGRIGHNGGGGRRGVGGGISVGNANGSGNGNGYGSGGGVRHGQEHRGGFDAQRRGRGHQYGPGQPHRQPGPQMAFARAPHPFPAQLPPPPFWASPIPPPFFAPPMPPPPFYGAYYGPVIGYAHPEFAPGFYAPPPQDALHFMPYPALPSHGMLPHMEQQQAAHPQEEPEAAQLKAEELEKDLRARIEYYFSENNLCKDLFLKQNMDAEGWVPLTTIAGFKKIVQQTTDLEVILKSVLSSSEVEVQDGKIRRRTGWQKYLLPRH